jgi:hypothetical protein
MTKRMRNDQPKHVSARHNQGVVIKATEDRRCHEVEQNGQALTDALKNSPLRDLDFDRIRYLAPVRDVEL